MKHDRLLPWALAGLAGLAGSLAVWPAGADPMRPLAAPAKASAATARADAASRPADRALVLGRLIAIRRDSRGRWQALIDERWVGVGDTLDRARVAAIAANQVELVVAGTSRPTSQTLHLLPPLQASGASGATGSKTR